MYSGLVFFLTLFQVGLIVGCYALQWSGVFLAFVVYGSPFYLLMTLLKTDSVFLDSNPLYLGLLVYHVIKYFLFFRAQMIEDRNSRLTAAIVMEAAYLALSAYYLN